MRSIEDLTQVVIEKVNSGDEKGRASSRDYKDAGDALRQIWEQFQYGDVRPWLDEHWLPKWSESRAYKLKDISEYWDAIVARNDGAEPLGWNDALRLLDEVKPRKKKPKPISPAKLVKSKLAKSISNAVTDLDRAELTFLCDRPDAIEHFISQMQLELAPLASVMSGWSAADGFKQPPGDDREYADDELRDRMTSRILAAFTGATLSAYQEQVIREYFEEEYDEDVAENWRTHFKRHKAA